MTDLVAELLTWEAAPNVRGEVRSIAKRSAAEIARLTRDLATARADVVSLTKHNTGLLVIEAQKDREIARLRAVLNSKPTPEAILLQARKPGGEWIDIFPAQLSWMAKEGFDVRALDGDAEQTARPKGE